MHSWLPLNSGNLCSRLKTVITQNHKTSVFRGSVTPFNIGWISAPWSTFQLTRTTCLIWIKFQPINSFTACGHSIWRKLYLFLLKEITARRPIPSVFIWVIGTTCSGAGLFSTSLPFMDYPLQMDLSDLYFILCDTRNVRMGGGQKNGERLGGLPICLPPKDFCVWKTILQSIYS